MITTIENHQLKGITIKNVIVTIFSTASIVASVVTTYFGLKTDILQIRASQEAESKVNNLRISVLESEVSLLQKQVNGLDKMPESKSKKSALVDQQNAQLLSAVDKK
ncbi:MAG: hypothetical protein M3O71_26220 [Bacteroidota bacterium]|nr:hypothetical protein [Bacteroidota bacterium]